MPKGPAAAVAAILLAAALIMPLAAAEPAARVSDLPEGPFLVQSLWGAKRSVNADLAWLLLRPVWEEKLSGRGVRVAIVDTGVDATHPDLQGAIVAFKDFAGDRDGKYRNEPYDDHGHGTHVAAIVAGRGHFQPNPVHFYWIAGARGFAPGAELLIAKAMKHDGRGADVDVADAILWALDPNGDGDLSDGADVINLSIGIERSSGGNPAALNFIGTETRRAVNLALLRGVVVVVSSGNDGKTKVAEPGDIDGVITVGAVDRDGKPTAFTNVGDGFDLLAPGVLISAYPKELDVNDHARDGYAGLAGTSMAAPVVSGIVALMLESRSDLLAAKGKDKDYQWKVREVETVLKETAVEVPPGKEGRAYGAGVVDAHAALRSVDEPTGVVSTKAVAVLVALALLVGYVMVGIPALRFRRARKAARAAAAASAAGEQAAEAGR